MSARADADAMAAALAGASVAEAHGEVTLDVPSERITEACAAARDAGYDFLCDLAATDYLGYAGEGVAGYWASPTGAGARDLNHPASAGLGVVPAAPGSKRFAVSYQLLDRARARRAACACARGSTTASRCRASSACSRAPTTRSARPTT